MTTQNEVSYQISTQLTQIQGLPSESYQTIDNIVDSIITTDFVREVISFFEAEKSLQVLLTATRDLLQIFYQRWTSISLKESEDLYYFLIKILKEKAQQYVSCPRLLAHLILLLCEIIKTNYSELGFTTRVFDHILTFFHEEDNNHDHDKLQGIDLLNDLLQHMQITEDQENAAIDNGGSNLPDNTSIGLAIFIRLVENMNIEEEVSNRDRPFRRNIKNFQKNCLPRIITFTFQQIHKEFKMLNTQEQNHTEKEIKPALFRLLANCLKASHLVEFIKASEDSFHQLLPNNQFRPISLITHQIINGLVTNYFQNLDALKFLFEIYSAALEIKVFEICNNILQILTSLLTINSSLSRSAEKQKEYIQTLIEGINSIFSETTRKTESIEILLSLTSLISDINLKSSDFFLCKPENEKWFQLLYDATTYLVNEMPTEITLIHSFLQIWASFAQANNYIIEKSQAFSEYLSKISHLYLISRAQICGLNQKQPDSSGDPVDFTREFFLTNTKFIGKLIIYNDELCKFLATEFQNLQSNLNEKSLENTDAMRFIWIIYVFSDMIDCAAEDSQKSQLNKYVAKRWEFVCATIKFFNNSSPFYQSNIFAEAKIHFINQFILNYCLDRNLTENPQHISQMASELNFDCYNDLMVSLMNQILNGLPDPRLCPEIIKVLERLVSLLNCYYDYQARQAVIKRFFPNIDISKFLRIGKAPISAGVFSPLFKIHIENHFESIPLMSKLRSSLYESLSKILDLSLEVNNDRSVIETFMGAFEARSHQIFQLLQEDAVNFEEQCVTLFNDLTSSLTCIGSEGKYHGFMEQILRMGFFQIIEKILQVTSSTNSEINLAILKFTGELIENTGSRLPKSSSEIRFVLISFALKVTRHIGQNTDINPETIASQKVFKVIPFIAKVLTNIQTAKLIDLGNIKLTYLDDLQSLCEVLFLLLNGCPLEILVAFPESPAKWIYCFLEIVARRKLSYFGQIPHEIWKKILEILHFGIQSVDLNVSINSDETLSHICHQLISSKSQSKNESQREYEPLFQYMSADSQKIQNILRTCFIIILNGEASNYSYLSKMIKGLSVVENEYFKSLGQELGTFYGQENQYQLMEHFNQLMKVNLSLHEKENFRGKLEDFAKNVASFQ